MNEKTVEMIIKYGRRCGWGIRRKRCMGCGDLTYDWQTECGITLCWSCAKIEKELKNGNVPCLGNAES